MVQEYMQILFTKVYEVKCVTLCDIKNDKNTNYLVHLQNQRLILQIMINSAHIYPCISKIKFCDTDYIYMKTKKGPTTVR